MLWTDVNEIAIELCEKYPEIDPQYVLFTEKHHLLFTQDNLFLLHKTHLFLQLKVPCAIVQHFLIFFLQQKSSNLGFLASFVR